jgi:hypothetical protein
LSIRETSVVMLGFGIGIGGLGVGLIGLLVEAMGIRYTIELLVWVPLVAGLAGLGIGTTESRPSGVVRPQDDRGRDSHDP